MSIHIFDSEKEMQKWLSDEFQDGNSMGDLIINQEEFEDFEPENMVQQKFHDIFSYCLSPLGVTSVITENEDICLSDTDSLKPDFVLYGSEGESIIIIELKNEGNATRQAATEISAYASGIKSYIPFMGEGDIINIIISPEWPTLLRQYVFQDIFWLQKNVLCLEPVKEDNELHLRIKNIKELVSDDFSLKISEQQLGGYQVCLYDDANDLQRMHRHLEQMKTALSAIATKGYALKNHGFAFLWRDNFPMSPYSITIMNFAPFQLLERFFHDEEFEPNEMTNRLVQVIKDYSPEGHGHSLDEMYDAGGKFLENFCSPRPEGFTTWRDLKEFTTNESELLAFQGWGIFGELFYKKLQQAYETDNRISSTDPRLGLELINELIDPQYEFIDLAYYGDYGEEDENVEE